MNVNPGIKMPLSVAVHRAGKILIGSALVGQVMVLPAHASVNSPVSAFTHAENTHQEIAQNSITIIDGLLNQADVLESASTSSNVYHLDTSSDGIKQISQILKQHKNLNSVHILSHGGAGYLTLGTGILNQDNLAYYQSEIQAWGQALASGSDLMFYGCNTAQGDKGSDLLHSLAKITGADVAGSTDITGDNTKGGDWDLEYKVGGVTTASLEPNSYQHTLSNDGQFIVGDGSGGGGGGGSVYGNVVTGNGGAGGGGDDTLIGTSGNDVMFGDGSGGGGAGNANHSDDPVVKAGVGGSAGNGNDKILGGAGNDILFGDGFTGQTGGDGTVANSYSKRSRGGDGGLGGGGGGATSYNYSGFGTPTVGGKGGIGAGGGGGGDTSFGGDGGIGGGGGSAGDFTKSEENPYGSTGVGGGLGATNGLLEYRDSAAGGGGGGGFFGVGGFNGFREGQSSTGSGGNGGGYATGTGNGGSACQVASNWAGGGGGGAFGNAAGGTGNCDSVENDSGGNYSGGNGQDGDEQQYSMTDTGGVVHDFVFDQLASLLSTHSEFGAGTDLLDGGAGSDELFGLGGVDTFQFKLSDAVSGSDKDTIWDFTSGETIRLLDNNESLISESNLAILLGVQVTDGTDRSVGFAEDGNSVTILVKGIDTDLTSADFEFTEDPDVFTFTDQAGVAISSILESDVLTMSGLASATTIEISGGEYRINEGDYTTEAGVINEGDTVQVRVTSADIGGDSVDAVLTVGTLSDTFTVATVVDSTPNAFSFTDKTGVALSTLTESDTQVITGINTGTEISITGGEYSIDGSDFTNETGTIYSSDGVTLRVTSSASNDTQTDVTLTIGGVSDTFSVTTMDSVDSGSGGGSGSMGLASVFSMFALLLFRRNRKQK